ncbi:MAG: GcvT family protein [Alphaproteobacteria bacterium]|nr:GcvT family protein [Alphaproteobacteria bacterium]
MKDHARVLIVGGGVTGCGLAYHLAKLGLKDIVLVEKNELTAGATWHAAGHVMHYSASALLTRLQKETTDFLWQLEKDTGQSVGFHQTGAIRLITLPEQMTEFRRAVAKAPALGMDMEIVGPEEVKRHFPLISTEGLLGGVWTPGDGHADPSGITFAYAKGARSGGVEINQHTKVTALEWTGRDWKVTTDKGVIRAETVVNCAGMWAQELANMVGVTLPLIVFMHQHLVTEDHPAVKSLARELVLLRDPVGGFNCRQEGKGLLSGVYEHAPEFVFVDGIPPAFGKELMAPNYDRSADFIARAIKRVPALGEVGVKTVYNGPTSRTPDHQPLFGPVPGVPNYFVAAGYAAGIVQSGFTKYVAQWVAEGEPEIDLTELDVRRFGVHANRAFTFAVVHAGHAFSNLPNYPYGERGSGRPARTGPLYDRLAAAGAVFGVRNGWEVPYWFAPAGAERKEKLGFKRPNWFEPVGAEIRAALQGAGIADVSYLSKFDVSGPGAGRWLDGVFACRLPSADGSVAHGPMLTHKGGVASCMTIARLAADRFVLVGPGEHEARDADHLARALPGDRSVHVDNATGRLAALLLTGPNSGTIVAACAKADLTVSFAARGFPEGSVRRVGLGYAPAIVVRHDETGCGDWLVLAPAEFARALYDALKQAGAAHGIVDMGVRALDALRLEQGIGAISTDIDRAMTPQEAGIERMVDWGKGPFTGRDAARSRKPRRQLCLVAVESGQVDPFVHDTVYDGDKAVALVGTGGFGYRSQRSLALTALPADRATASRSLSVEIFGKRYPARPVPSAADRMQGAAAE